MDQHGRRWNATPEITRILDSHEPRWTVPRRFASRGSGVRFPSAPLTKPQVRGGISSVLVGSGVALTAKLTAKNAQLAFSMRSTASAARSASSGMRWLRSTTDGGRLRTGRSLGCSTITPASTRTDRNRDPTGTRHHPNWCAPRPTRPAGSPRPTRRFRRGCPTPSTAVSSVRMIGLSFSDVVVGSSSPMTAASEPSRSHTQMQVLRRHRRRSQPRTEFSEPEP